MTGCGVIRVSCLLVEGLIERLLLIAVEAIVDTRRTHRSQVHDLALGQVGELAR